MPAVLVPAKPGLAQRDGVGKRQDRDAQQQTDRQRLATRGPGRA